MNITSAPRAYLQIILVINHLGNRRMAAGPGPPFIECARFWPHLVAGCETRSHLSRLSVVIDRFLILICPPTPWKTSRLKFIWG